MKIAVTGGNGFIGRHVVDALEQRSIKVMSVFRPSPITSSIVEGPNVVKMDLRDPPPDAFEKLGCPDVLVHLAWHGVSNCKSMEHFEEELPAHYRFLKALIQSGLKSLVVSGTCYEYGMQSGPLHESLETRPTNPYGLAKDMLRRQLEYLKSEQPFSLTWARLFYLYGDGQPENSLLTQLKRAVERGDKVFDMSGGEQLRDYLAVTEAAGILASLAMAGRNMGVVNVCAGKPISVRKLVEGWIEDNNWNIALNCGHFPYRDYEPMAFWGVRQKFDF